MKLSTHEDLNNLNPYLIKFLQIVGYQSWKKRLNHLRNEIRANKITSHFLKTRFQIELAFLEIMNRRKYGKSLLKENDSSLLFKFASFMIMTTRIYDNLTDSGKARLKGMFENASKSDTGLARWYSRLK